MRLGRFAVVSALALAAVMASGSVGSGTGLAAAPETLAPTDPGSSTSTPATPVASTPAAAVEPSPPPAPQPTLLRPELIAHRGDHSVAVENTPSAIAAAMVGGADAVEFDVVSTADNIPVVLHDPNLAKHTVNCTGLASAKTYRQIRKCLKKDGRPIPNLDEVLREIPAGKRAYIHLKTPAGRGIATRLMSAVNAYGMNSDTRATFFSFHPAVLSELRDAGALTLGLIFNASNEAAGWASDYPILVPYRVSISKAEIRAAHARGQQVVTVAGGGMTPAKAMSLQVDGYMADNLSGALAKLG